MCKLNSTEQKPASSYIITRLIALFFLFQFSSCERPSDCEKDFFAEEFKAFVMKPPGSTWTYTDTLNNVIDTVTLLEQNLFFDNKCKVNTNPHEELTQRFTSSLLFKDSIIEVTASSQGGVGKYDSPFGIFQAGGVVNTIFEGTIDSMQVSGMAFRDVWVFSRKLDAKKEKFYWSRDIGIIKKVCYRSKLNTDTILYHFDLIGYDIK